MTSDTPTDGRCNARTQDGGHCQNYPAEGAARCRLHGGQRTDQAETAPDADEMPDRDEILALLEDGIREAHQKVDSGQVDDTATDRVRIQWLRALAYATGQYRHLMNDRDLDELDEKLTALEEQHNHDR